MAKTFISTFGFTESAVLAPIVKVGLEKGDKIIILIPSGVGDQKRAINALEKLRNILRTMFNEKTIIERIEIPINDFALAVSKIRKIIEIEASKNPVYVNLSGGMRALVLQTYTAVIMARLSNTNITFTDIELEGSAGSVKILPLAPLTNYKGTKRKILEELKKYEDFISMEALANNLKLSLSTLSRNLRELSADGLIISKKKKRKIFTKISDYGKMFA